MKLLRKQPPNRRVMLACLPCIAGGVYFFGWRSLAMVAVASAVGFLVEWLFCRARKEPVSEAVFVTAFIFSLILPPTVGWHVVVVGMVVAILFAKEVFGGFGRNIFNPAMGGRCFVYVCFAVAMTGQWAPNALQQPDATWYGALDRWNTVQPEAGEAYAITGATPQGRFKAQALDYARKRGEANDASPAPQPPAPQPPEPPTLSALWWGSLGGSMGVTSVLLILIGGVYLVVTGTANRTTVTAVVVSAAALGQIYHMMGYPQAPDGLRTLLGGGFLFGAFFMATDPISSPKTALGRVLYGVIIGGCTVTIRAFSVFNGGFMFSLLLANMFAPTLDIMSRALDARRAARATRTAAATPTPAAAETGGAS